MPQFAKGGKWVFGWTVVDPAGEIRIPPAAFVEYGFTPGERAVFLRGSQRSRGFGLARQAKLAESRISLNPRVIGHVVVGENCRVACPSRMGMRTGERLLVVRGSGLALGFVQRGPIYEEAFKHPEIEAFS